MSEPKYTYDPIEFYGRVHYDAFGQPTMIEVSVSGRATQQRYPDVDEPEGVGSLFEAAFEGAKTLLVTQRLVVPKPGSEGP